MPGSVPYSCIFIVKKEHFLLTINLKNRNWVISHEVSLTFMIYHTAFTDAHAIDL